MKKQIAVILAAGKGTRMNSDGPKVLCRVLFEPMIRWVTDACRKAGIEKICVVTGYKGELVRAVLDEDIETAVQEVQLGTAHAVMSAADFLRRYDDADVAVLNGDAPFIDPDTIQNALLQHRAEGNAVTVITARIPDPTGYGRIIRGSDGGVMRIVEHKDANSAERAVNEINSGDYWFSVRDLLSVLFNVKNENQQGEYYLPDTLSMLLQNKKKAGAYVSENPDVILGANSRRQLLELNEIARKNKLFSLMDEGVEIPCLDGIMVGRNVTVGKETLLLPGTILRGNTRIGEHCEIGPNTLVEDSTVGEDTKLNAVQCYRSSVGSGVSIGPFCHIRPNTVIRDNVHIGDFVEIKNSDIGNATHIAHLSYIGDSDVGERVNFGCGVAVANYDGIHKHRCVVGDGAFIGCNTNLVAPVSIGKNGYTAAGSTITADVPDEAMGIARARQVNKADYNRVLRGKKDEA